MSLSSAPLTPRADARIAGLDVHDKWKYRIRFCLAFQFTRTRSKVTDRALGSSAASVLKPDVPMIAMAKVSNRTAFPATRLVSNTEASVKLRCIRALLEDTNEDRQYAAPMCSLSQSI